MNAHCVESLFLKYYARLCLYASNILMDSDLAEDVVSGVFMNILAQEGKENRAIELSYLYRSVKNGCLKVIRKESAHTKYLNSGLLFEEKSYDFHIIESELTVALLDLLETLPEGCSLILKMSYMEGLKNAEIAEKLRVSIHTVKSQKSRGLMLLRQRVSLHQLLSILLILKNI